MWSAERGSGKCGSPRMFRQDSRQRDGDAGTSALLRKPLRGVDHHRGGAPGGLGSARDGEVGGWRRLFAFLELLGSPALIAGVRSFKLPKTLSCKVMLCRAKSTPCRPAPTPRNTSASSVRSWKRRRSTAQFPRLPHLSAAHWRWRLRADAGGSGARRMASCPHSSRPGLCSSRSRRRSTPACCGETHADVARCSFPQV